MSATCLRAYISDNRNGPFVELVDCVYTPSDYENTHEFRAYDNEAFKKAWNDVLRGAEIAVAFFNYRVGDMTMQLEGRIYPLYVDENDGLIHAPARIIKRRWIEGWTLRN